MSNHDPYFDSCKSNSHQRTYTSIRETSSVGGPLRQVATPWLPCRKLFYLLLRSWVPQCLK